VDCKAVLQGSFTTRLALISLLPFQFLQEFWLFLFLVCHAGQPRNCSHIRGINQKGRSHGVLTPH